MNERLLELYWALVQLHIDDLRREAAKERRVRSVTRRERKAARHRHRQLLIDR